MGLGVIVVLGFLAVQQSGDEPPDDAAFLTAVAERYEENRARFTRGTVTFDYQDGFADDLDAARRGELRDLCTATGEYVFNIEGKQPAYRYRREFNEQDSRAHLVQVGEGTTSTRLDSFRAVSNGSLALFDRLGWGGPGEASHSAEINAGDEEFFRSAKVPYEIGFPDRHLSGSLDHEIRAALKEERGASLGAVERDLRLDGRASARFTIEYPQGRTTYVLDGESDWMPIEQTSQNQRGTVSIHHFGDLRRVEGRGWLPFVKTISIKSLTRRLVIREADFETTPKPADFSLEFPEPITMVNAAKGLWYRKPQKVWSLASLPSSTSAKAQKLEVRREAAGGDPPPPLPGERDAPPWYRHPLAILAAAGASILTGVVLVRRRASGA